MSLIILQIENKIKTSNLSQDLKVICNGIKTLFTSNGFGAKISSGFGIAKPEIKGKLVLKMKNIIVFEKEILKPQMLTSFEKYLNTDGTVKKEFKGHGKAGLLSDKEYHIKFSQLKEGFSKFKKFRSWYNQSGKHWEEYIQSKNVGKPKWPTWGFKSFNDLINQSKEIKDLLMEIGGD